MEKPANRRLAGVLYTFSSSKNGKLFEIFEGSNSIGSSPQAQICLAHPSVSNNHAVIYAIEKNSEKCLDFRVVDAGSETGTFVIAENKKIQLFAQDKAPLDERTKIEIGLFELVFLPIDFIQQGYQQVPSLVVDNPPVPPVTPNQDGGIKQLLKELSVQSQPPGQQDGTTI